MRPTLERLLFLVSMLRVVSSSRTAFLCNHHRFSAATRSGIVASGIAPQRSNHQRARVSTMSAGPIQQQEGDMLFGKFVIPNASIFYRSSKSFAFVNLRPIVRGHVLVVPDAVIQHLDDMSEEQYIDLWKTVRIVQRILRETYPESAAFNVAVQDGSAAGQSVPHVHVHILPRSAGDFKRNDDVYDKLQAWAPREELQTKVELEVLPDEARNDRTRQQMADEAALYRSSVEKSKL